MTGIEDALSLSPVNRRAFFVATERYHAAGPPHRGSSRGHAASDLGSRLSTRGHRANLRTDGHGGLGGTAEATGPGPFPAIIYLHGGIRPFRSPASGQPRSDGETPSRFLAAGYVA